MRIHVRRTGGFAGFDRHAEIDTTGRDDAPQWHSVAEDALAAGRTEPPVGVPDGYCYQITVDGRTVYCADPRLTEEQRKLITWVLKEGA
ncbi:protealysin inhibitor emfourin [Streptomyces apocyni]|uniref:protealysin inhibitor emfourin n=1 Tax=Streptomyces apocyni TaxID=2654677 RepID=UPI0012EAB9CB|nr:protealysin inhibitor emfourin [Streptomyces apocyni]